MGAGFFCNRILQEHIKIASFKERSGSIRDSPGGRRRGLFFGSGLRDQHLIVTGWTLDHHPGLAAGDAHKLVTVATTEAYWHRWSFPDARGAMPWRVVAIGILPTGDGFRHQSVT